MHKNTKSYLALATDNMLYISRTEEPLNILLEKFSDVFSYEVRRGNEISFLNYRIIQTNHGIYIDQSNHIDQGILKDYFRKKIENVKFRLNPFTVDIKFEYELHAALPLKDKDKEES